jgi:hypothetical protein
MKQCTLPKSNEPLRYKDILGDILYHLDRGCVRSVDNSIHQHEAFLRCLLKSNMTLSNTSQPDNSSGYETTVDECSPFAGALDFFNWYYLPAIICTGMSVLFTDPFSFWTFKNLSIIWDIFRLSKGWWQWLNHSWILAFCCIWNTM